MIPYARQNISQSDIDAVIAVLKSDFLTQGPAVPAFEQAVAEYCRAKHGVAVNSATSALHVAYLALGLGPGDILWTSPNTFVASANCGLYCGAKVDFVDIDPETLNMSVSALQEKLELAEIRGCLPKVVVPVHFAGQSCQMREIKMLSQRYGFKIIEDASHAIGGKYLGKPVGCCEYSDITVFSFHAVKIMTTGEGGMAMTNDLALAEKMQLFRSHGITRDFPPLKKGGRGDLWYYEQITLGHNYRMTDIQAALGLSQLKRLDEFVACRRRLATRYTKEFKEASVKMQCQHENTDPAWHLYVIRVRERDRVFAALREKGIGVNVHYIPVHTQPYYQKLGFKWGNFPQAESYYQEAMTLPLYVGLNEEQQESVIANCRDYTS
ncbi:MAG: UDP-4-amino-4,6-dideoxy-N-acetyl-beta-L-altrosamine transaminase [Deltaproteobacteria bacterium]|nr:UDP-4-amino-4,6-dideoxy-N-acetyl-beta-L-altrosamine transaminase [Deltaproteobacteria bacterium]